VDAEVSRSMAVGLIQRVRSSVCTWACRVQCGKNLCVGEQTEWERVARVFFFTKVLFCTYHSSRYKSGVYRISLWRFLLFSRSENTEGGLDIVLAY
jgi:hypothetical protein